MVKILQFKVLYPIKILLRLLSIYCCLKSYNGTEELILMNDSEIQPIHAPIALVLAAEKMASIIQFLLFTIFLWFELTLLPYRCLN